MSFQQTRLSIDQINKKQSNTKTIHPKHLVDCQDDDIKDIFDNDDNKDYYFDESQLTLQNFKNAYDMIYYLLTI